MTTLTSVANHTGTAELRPRLLSNNQSSPWMPFLYSVPWIGAKPNVKSQTNVKKYCQLIHPMTHLWPQDGVIKHPKGESCIVCYISRQGGDGGWRMPVCLEKATIFAASEHHQHNISAATGPFHTKLVCVHHQISYQIRKITLRYVHTCHCLPYLICGDHLDMLWL